MITPKKILEKVKELLYEEYPSFTYYIQDEASENLMRPSFKIYIYSDRSEWSGRLSRDETISVGIVYYHQLGKSIPEDMRTIEVYSAIKDIFRKGFIQVEDRTLKVDLIKGDTRDEIINLIVRLVYSEEIPAVNSNYSIVGEVNINTINKQ